MQMASIYCMHVRNLDPYFQTSERELAGKTHSLPSRPSDVAKRLRSLVNPFRCPPQRSAIIVPFGLRAIVYTKGWLVITFASIPEDEVTEAIGQAQWTKHQVKVVYLAPVVTPTLQHMLDTCI
jgi:hypothetical protein